MKPATDSAAFDSMRYKLFALPASNTLNATPQPHQLFHYTDAQAVVYIVKPLPFWATHAGYLNDQTEFIAGMNIVRETIQELLTDEPQLHLRRMLERVQSGLAHEEHRDVYPYLVSFSASEDSLSQWRAYGASGSGFAIGYNVATLQRSGRLFRCVYDASVLTEQLRCNYRSDIVPLLEECLRGRVNFPPDYLVPGQVNEGLLTYFRSMAASYKHAGYRDENEWRLVVNATKSERRYRTSPLRGIVPYRELPILQPDSGPREPVQVIIGPTQEPKSGYAAAAFVLEDAGYVNVDSVLQHSKIPYRR